MIVDFSPLQISTGDWTTILYIGSFVVLMLVSLLWGNRIQAATMLNYLGRNLRKLQDFKDGSRKELLEYLTVICRVQGDSLPKEIDRMLAYFTIIPETIDPAGVVGKIEQVVRLQDDRMKKEIKEIAPQADVIQQSVAENILGIAAALLQVYKIIRHFYIQGQKMKNPYMLAAAQMSLPILLQQAEAYYGAIESFKLAQPIGDGVGAMVVGNLMVGRAKTEIAKETVYAKSEYKGRTLHLVKAEGPMGRVGMPDDAVKKLLDDKSNGITTMIMIDAALKLEGETSGEITQGIGAAIGGIGVEKFRIEEAATISRIPMFAVVVRESIIDNISIMTKEISEATFTAREAVLKLIETKTRDSDGVLIVGVGNTLGIGQ
ncbi:MAG: DUF1512 family protein [Nitrososphaerota archaeon]|nr:DUF1512 family protein [Nitrososphaerota archaeon]